VQVPIAASGSCAQYGPFISSTEICAGDGTGADACGGDSGGPLGRFYSNGRFAVAGIVSWGPEGCALVNSYGTYTKVSVYINWIKQYVPSNVIVGATGNVTNPTAPTGGNNNGGTTIVVFGAATTTGNAMNQLASAIVIAMMWLLVALF